MGHNNNMIFQFGKFKFDTLFGICRKYDSKIEFIFYHMSFGQRNSIRVLRFFIG